MNGEPARRVVVTGIGLFTPLGGDRETTWERLIAGECGLIRLPDSHLAGLRLPCEIPPGLRFGGPASASLLSPAQRTGEPIVDLALQAADEAVRDARLDPQSVPAYRGGIVLGTSKGGLRSFAAFQRAVLRGQSPAREGEAPAEADRLWDHFFSDTPARTLSATFGFRGAALCPVAACATGLIAIQRGAELIRSGDCDVVLAGSSDASLLPALQASFHRLGVLARDFDDPATACRPFDAHRDGFLIGEGAAVLVLEHAERAQERGAVPYAEWLGGGLAADAFGLTQLEPASPALVHLLSELPARCGFDWSEVDTLNLHGTGTEMNDACEAAALRAAIGPRIRDIPASSLKGALGHLLGAAGSVETALMLLAMRRGILPANRNLERPFDGCELNLPTQPLAVEPRVALKLSLGFGGHLAASVFRRIS